jgi:hypothetical protein
LEVAVKLSELMIADQAHSVLDRVGREVVGLHLAVERHLHSIGDPSISWRMETAETGFLRALAGKRRDVLLIQHARLREYVVLISARAHGRVLHVAWMVLVTPRLASDLRRLVRFEAEPGARFDIGAELDVFDVLDLKAFIGITRLALRQAIREITDDEAAAPGLMSDAERNE